MIIISPSVPRKITLIFFSPRINNSFFSNGNGKKGNTIYVCFIPAHGKCKK